MPLKVSKQKPQPPRVILYGPEGIGKTTFGAESEDPIFVCTEDGATNVPVDKVEPDDGRAKAVTYDEVLVALQTVATEKHDYRTVVVDTLNGVVTLAAEQVNRKVFGGDWGKFLAYGGNHGWPATVEELRQAVNHLDTCRARGMTVILLAHEGSRRVPNALEADYLRAQGSVDHRAWALFAEWADVIGHARYHHVVIDVDQRTRRGKAMGDTTRVVRFAGTAAEAAKCRVGFELPDEMPLSYAAFRAALGRDTYTLERVRELWGLLSPERVTKAMAWLGVARLENAPVHKLRQLLTHLQGLELEKEDANVA